MCGVLYLFREVSRWYDLLCQGHPVVTQEDKLKHSQQSAGDKDISIEEGLIRTKQKTKVVLLHALGTELIQFVAALAILHQEKDEFIPFFKSY